MCTLKENNEKNCPNNAIIIPEYVKLLLDKGIDDKDEIKTNNPMKMPDFTKLVK